MANLSQQRREKLLAFLETLKEQHSDDDSLMAIGAIEKELTSKKYGLVWEEHEEEVDVKMQTHIPVFTEDKSREIAENPDSENYNFLLEGDNLHSLKLLEKTHRGKIDVIYIDPPYNRGKQDFVYDDNYVEITDTYKHSKWLSFMSRRLEIAKTLLSKNGTIFISISDIEVSTLKLLCDDIFGEYAFVTCIPRIAKQQRSAQEKHMDVSHDYIICYSYSEDFIHIIKRIYDESKLKVDHIGTYIVGDTKAILADKSKGYSVGGDYDFEYNGKIYKPVDKNGIRNRWLWTKTRMEAAAKLGILVETTSTLRMQLYLDYKFDDKTNTMIPKNSNLIFHTSDFMTKSEYTNSTGSAELKAIDIQLFQRFNNPKPLALIKDLLRLCDKSNLLVLDFFAGSGTTAQAIMELNVEDSGNRRFILCTNNQNNICLDVTYPRIKTVITGKRADGSTYSDGIPANLKYYKTDFVAKDSEELVDELLEHIREMIQLEYGVKVDGRQYVMILDDEEMDDFEQHIDSYPDLKAIFISQDVLLSTPQEKLLQDYATYIIPDYYFDFELREAGELW